MKLNEIHAYHDDPSMNTYQDFVETFLPDIEDILDCDWNGNGRQGLYTFDVAPSEKVEFRFLYKSKSRGHAKTSGGMLILSSHSIQMEVEFPPAEKMNIAALHDDPEVQKKLAARMNARPPSFFEKHPEKLDAILSLMVENGVDGVSAKSGQNIRTNEDAMNALKEVAANTKGGHFGDHFELNFLFLTEPLPPHEDKTPS